MFYRFYDDESDTGSDSENTHTDEKRDQEQSAGGMDGGDNQMWDKKEPSLEGSFYLLKNYL